MNPETLRLLLAILASIAAIIAGFYGVVTRPIVKMIELQSALVRTELKSEMALLQTELKSEMALLRTELKAEMKDMENRLNQRIDTHLVHR